MFDSQCPYGSALQLYSLFTGDIPKCPPLSLVTDSRPKYQLREIIDNEKVIIDRNIYSHIALVYMYMYYTIHVHLVKLMSMVVTVLGVYL